MKNKAIVLLLLLTGCSHLRPSAVAGIAAPHNTVCDPYDTKYVVWGGVAAGAGALGGAGGITSIATDTSTGARVGLGIAALVVGGVSVASIFVSQHYAKMYAECVGEKTPDPSAIQ